MRLALTLFLAAMLVFPAVGLTHDKHKHCDLDGDTFLDDCDVDWDEDTGTLTITSEEDDEEIVVITKKYVLTVNGEKIDLDKKQKELVKDYYKHMKKLHVMAAEIGEEAAKLGEWGGKVAAKAIREVCDRLLDYDDEEEMEKLEEEIEAEAEEIEKVAEKIEAKAEKLEEVAENLKDLHYEMKDAVPELKALEWF